MTRALAAFISSEDPTSNSQVSVMSVFDIQCVLLTSSDTRYVHMQYMYTYSQAKHSYTVNKMNLKTKNTT